MFIQLVSIGVELLTLVYLIWPTDSRWYCFLVRPELFDRAGLEEVPLPPQCSSVFWSSFLALCYPCLLDGYELTFIDFPLPGWSCCSVFMWLRQDRGNFPLDKLTFNLLECHLAMSLCYCVMIDRSSF
jgi:hypothetical protein